MNRFGFFATIAGVVGLWYERIFTVEWIVFLLKFGWEGFLWAGKAVFQMAAALVLLGFTGNYDIHWPEWRTSLPLTSEQTNAFVNFVKSRVWRGGDTPAEVLTFGGEQFWIVQRGTVDNKTFVDKVSHPLDQKCMIIYAAPVKMADGHLLAPTPYIAGLLL